MKLNTASETDICIVIYLPKYERTRNCFATECFGIVCHKPNSFKFCEFFPKLTFWGSVLLNIFVLFIYYYFPLMLLYKKYIILTVKKGPMHSHSTIVFQDLENNIFQ